MSTVAPPAPPPPDPEATVPVWSSVTHPEPSTPVAPQRGRWLSSGARAVLADVVGLGALGLIALSGLGPAYGGRRYLVVGGVGLVLGLGLGLVAALRRVPLWVLALVVLVVEVLVGACLVQPDSPLTLVVPSTETVGDMVVAAFQGWVNLLTTTVPVGSAQNLLVVPWAAGLVAGAAAMSLSRRVSSGGWALLALVPLAALLVGGLLMGVEEPAWTLQATAFSLVALVWGSVRQRSARSAGLARARRPRIVSAIGLLVVAGALGLVVGETALVSGPEERFVLRDHVDPPVDLRSVPSPLEGFRRYLDEDRREEVIFTVDGLEEGDRLRLATLDAYDGTIWHVQGGQTGAESSNLFQRVGQQLPVTETGGRRTVTVEVGDYSDAWLPTLGATESVTFSGDRASQLSEGFRYNMATDTAAAPGGLRPGDRYVLDAVVPDAHTDLDEGVADPRVTVPDPATVEAVGLRLATLAPDPADSPLERARQVEAQLAGGGSPANRGYFSDGELDDRGDPPQSRSGHSAERMSALLAEGAFMVGNEEQFASAMALLAAELGLPSRVVVGFAPGTRSRSDQADDGGPVEVTGSDISAWAEVAVDGAGWVPLLPTPLDREAPPPEDVRRVPPPDRYVPPPPVTVPRVPVPRKGGGTDVGCTTDCAEGASGPLDALPPWVRTAGAVTLPPLLLIGGLTALMAGLKAGRRRRRRRRGSPGARVAGGWADVCDLACDLGDVVPRRATRREVAVLLARPGVVALARSADSLVFAPSPVDPAAAETYWAHVDQTRASMLAPLSRFARWRALVNPRSLRRGNGAPRPRAGGGPDGG